MTKLCEGRVAVVTGAGRGIGREHALMLAEQGARVIVNDLGGDEAGHGADLTPAQEVVADIEAMGGERLPLTGPTWLTSTRPVKWFSRQSTLGDVSTSWSTTPES